MKLLDKINLKKDKKEPQLTNVDTTNGVIQLIDAEVIKVGSEVTGEIIDEKNITPSKNKKNKYKPINFSYKYKFTDPISGEMREAYDDLLTVEIGEQIYDVGEHLQIIYSSLPNKVSNNDFTITRRIIFPEIINKKKKRIKIAKIIYFIVLFTSICVCMCYSSTKIPITSENQTTSEVETSNAGENNNDEQNYKDTEETSTKFIIE